MQRKKARDRHNDSDGGSYGPLPLDETDTWASPTTIGPPLAARQVELFRRFCLDVERELTPQCRMQIQAVQIDSAVLGAGQQAGLQLPLLLTGSRPLHHQLNELNQ
ncbi:MAG: hypothetical protein WBF17_09440 [Phycisphaerae bacterium]